MTAPTYSEFSGVGLGVAGHEIKTCKTKETPPILKSHAAFSLLSL
jgi:hypothetical protein